MDGLRMAGATDPGRERERNEDAIAWDAQRGYAILADGVGGQTGGDVASRIVIGVVERQLRELHADGARGALTEAVEAANREVLTEADTHPLLRGMGSTVVAAVFEPDALTVAHVGDSRLYRLRSGVLEQLTQDHSLVQELLTAGVMSREDARDSNLGNIITRALGSAPQVQVDVARHELRPGDRVLLCSDGLSDLANEQEIAEVLARDGAPEAAATDLVALANARGGKDNISVVLVDVPHTEKAHAKTHRKTRRRKPA